MFVALPFHFLCRLLYYLAYSMTRVPVCCRPVYLAHYCGVAPLYHRFYSPERLPMRWGAIAGYGGFALIYWGYRHAIRKRAWIWRRQVPCSLRSVALLKKHCRYWFSFAAMLACGGFGVALLVR